MAQHIVVVLIVLGGVCMMASQIIKPSAVIRHPAVGLWTGAVVFFVTALLMRGRRRPAGVHAAVMSGALS